MKKFVVGDIHGAHKALLQVLERSGFDKDQDRLVCLGDVADGFPEVPECFDELLSIKNLVYVLGNHDCVAEGTEVLTDEGWVKIENWDGSKIAQYDISSKEISYVFPSAYIRNEPQECMAIESYDSKQVVSLNHDVLINNKKIKAKDLLGKDILNTDIPNVAQNSSCGIDLSDDMIRYYTWIITDGCLYKSSLGKVRIQFKLSKDSKIQSLRSLLDKLHIPYTFRAATKCGINKLQPYMIRIYGKYARDVMDYLNGDKSIPSTWSNMDSSQLTVFFNTIIETDGSRSNAKIIWNSINKRNLDIINIACVQSGFRTSIKSIANGSGFKNGKQQYKFTYYTDKRFNFKVNIYRVGKLKTYCFTMGKGTIVTRHSGKIAITGNCWLSEYFRFGATPHIWTSQGGKATLDAYVKLLNDGDTERRLRHQNLLESSPYYFVDEDNRLYVHGGFDWHRPIEDQDGHDLMWDRHLIQTAFHWYFRGNGDRVKSYKEVFLGHTALAKRDGKYLPANFTNVWNLDTGAGWNGVLTLMDVDTKEYWQSDNVLDLYSGYEGRS